MSKSLAKQRAMSKAKAKAGAEGRKRAGRKRGSRNKGYFFRKGRGWHTKEGGTFTALTDESGERLRDRNIPEAVVKAAYLRFAAAERQEQTAQQKAQAQQPSITLLEVCQAYLLKAKADGAEKTFQDRADTLFDLTTGFPAKYRKSKSPPPESERIHPGLGQTPVAELRGIDIERWLQAHTWTGGKRTRIQAVKRAINYAVESGLIERNPIRGFKVQKSRGRITYITPEQEAAIRENSAPEFATAVQVLIRTGARPGCEFAALTAAHVRDHRQAGNPDRMEWVFSADESKTHRLRVIRITDPEIIAIVRRQVERHPVGPIFRNTRGEPWNKNSLGDAFTRARRKLAKKGIELDSDCCVYACRHTYAKRTLQGFWSGKATNIETLARLMGNSPQICREHYLSWCDHYTEPLWEAC